MKPPTKSVKEGERPPLKGRILCVDDYPIYADMIAMMLEKRGGHTVQSEIVPVSLKVIERFKPDVIIVTLVRKLETLSAGGMQDFFSDVEGAKAFREIAKAARAGQLPWPIVVTSLAVLERELPHDEGLDYVAFLEIPQKLDVLLVIIQKILEAKAEDAKIIPE
jgi:CheY-like chemotaxis protein